MLALLAMAPRSKSPTPSAKRAKSPAAKRSKSPAKAPASAKRAKSPAKAKTPAKAKSPKKVDSPPGSPRLVSGAEWVGPEPVFEDDLPPAARFYSKMSRYAPGMKYTLLVLMAFLAVGMQLVAMQVKDGKIVKSITRP